MPIHTEIILEAGYLRLQFSGEYESGDVSQFINDILSLCKEHHYKKVLCDNRKVVGNIPIADTYKFGQQLAAARVQPIRFAFLCSAEQMQPGRFFENVAVTRGVTAKVSTDSDELMDWLNIKHSEHTAKKNH